MTLDRLWGIMGEQTRRREVFFFSACFYRGIRDDIEEEDEQVSDPSNVPNLLLIREPPDPNLPSRPIYGQVSPPTTSLTLFFSLLLSRSLTLC